MNTGTLRQFLLRLRTNERWVLVGFVAVAVALPTLFFLIFLRRSLVNEDELQRNLVNDRLISRLPDTRTALAMYLNRHPALREPAEAVNLPPGERFLRAIERNQSDSFILLNEDGTPLFPVLAVTRSSDQLSAPERLALDLRDELRTSSNRAATWRKIAPQLKALPTARDLTGRLILPGLELFALQQANLEPAEHASVLAGLRTRLLDYREPMPSAQRLFLAEELRKIDPMFVLPAARAESRVVELFQRPLPSLEPGVLTRVNAPLDYWVILSQDKTRLALFHMDRLLPKLSEVVWTHLASQGMGAKIRLTGDRRPSDHVTLAPAGPQMPDCEIVVFRTGDPDEATARLRRQRYYAVGAGVIALIGLSGFFAIRRFLTQSQATELRHDFLSTVSHELKTPLTSIRLLVDTLQDGQWANPERTKQYSEIMQREIARLTHLVDSFLTYTRLERGKLRFDFTETDPAHVAEHAMTIVGAKFRGHCAFTVDVEPELPLIFADSDTLITAVLNLLDNAYKYSPNGGRITFRVFVKGKHVCFSIEDTGIGLTPADCRRVLQQYYRVDSHATRGIGGAGLGLSIVKNVAEAHGGDLGVRSELGKGSCFTLRIPSHNHQES